MSENIDKENLSPEYVLELMGQGVIVHVRMRRWRGRITLSPEEWGLKLSDKDGLNIYNGYFSLGCQKLLPPKIISEINALEKSARRNLENHSYGTMWGRFVPYGAFFKWKKRNDDYYDVFMEAARSLGDQYDAIIHIVKEDYKVMAKDVWKRLYPNSTGAPPMSFVDDFVSKVIAKIPSSQHLVSSFKYEVVYSFIPQNLLKSRGLIASNSDIEKKVKQQIVHELIDTRYSTVRGFVDSTLGYLRREIHDSCKASLSVVARESIPNRINKQQVTKLKFLVKRVKLLDFFDDERITDAIVKMGDELEVKNTERNNAAIVAILNDLVEITKKEVNVSNFCSVTGDVEV